MDIKTKNTVLRLVLTKAKQISRERSESVQANEDNNKVETLLKTLSLPPQIPAREGEG